MGLLGSGWDDPQSQGLLALASGMISGNFGKGVSDMNATLAGAQDVALKRKLMQAQIGNLDSEVLNRQATIAKQQGIQDLFKDLLNPNTRFAENTAGALPGQAGSGTMDPANFQPNTSRPPDAGGLNLSPEMLLRAKALGLDLVDIAKYARPDMQVSGGYAYDKNNVKPGFLPQLNTSQNGQTSMVQIGANGQPFVSAPQGSLDTYSAYRKADEGAKAGFDVVDVPLLGGGKTPKTRAQYVADLSKPQQSADFPMGAGPFGSSGLDMSRVTPEQAAQLRALDPQAFEAGVRRFRESQPGTPSPADTAKAVDTAKADVVRDTGAQSEMKLYGKLTAAVDRARALLTQNPTSSGAGSLVDSAANFFGKSTAGADVASKLDTLSGWMTANVPRMEGPQSNYDVLNYRVMAAAVGDRTKPISQRLAALDELKTLQDKYADLNGGPAKAAPDAPSPSKSFKDYGYKDEAAAIRDAHNTIMRNPGAKAEVMKRLQAMGVDAKGGGW